MMVAVAPAMATKTTADEPYRFTLYVSGRSASAQQAMASVQALLSGLLRQRYLLSVVDVITQPKGAPLVVLSEPMLVRESPGERRSISGDLSDLNWIIQALDLVPLPPDQADQPGQAGQGAPPTW